MQALPDIVTHNYHPDRGIGGNICNLPRDEAEQILDRLRAMGRSLRPDYLDKRLRVEDWLIAAKAEKLGSTPLTRPIYFFLGDFADGKDASRPASLVMPLAAFPPGVLTFTTADSMTSYLRGVVAKDPHAALHHGQVFTRTEIEAVAATGLLGDTQKPSFIEMQVWDDRPIRAWLAARCGAALPSAGRLL